MNYKDYVSSSSSRSYGFGGTGINAGALRHRVTIQKATESINEKGETVPTWETFATVWAAVEPLRGREYFQSNAIQSELTTRIRIRYLAGVNPHMRVLYNGRTFHIQAVIDVDERHREMQLMCIEDEV